MVDEQMDLTLANFEQIIDPAILQRGRSYYTDGRVIDLEEYDEGYWRAAVEGTYVYRVGITFEADGRLDWACECPYDWGPVCKHVAAVLYAMTETAVPALPEKSKPGKKRKTRADKIRAAIGELSREELSDLLLEVALNDRDLAHLILARYGLDKGNKQAYARLVQDALQLGQERDGFLDYWGAARAAKAIYRLLHRAETDFEQGPGPGEAVPIYQAVIEGVVPAMNYADDSMGMLGGCIEAALEGLQRIAEEPDSSEREAVYEYCMAEAPKDLYAEWDWRWDLAGIAAQAVETSAQRATLFAVLDHMAARHAGEGWLGDYKRERAATIKLSVIRRLDGTAEEQAFLEAHLQHERMRMALARFHLQHGDLTAARQVCMEWLERPEGRMPGLVPNFLDILLSVAEAEGNTEEQVRLAVTLFEQTGNFAYYERTKELLGADAWLDFRSDFIERVRQGEWVRVNVGALFVAEEMWEELLSYVLANPRTAYQYHEYLALRFPRELSKAYEHLALATLEQKVNRRGYQEACSCLLRMQQLGQSERVSELVAQFREQYKKRRALMDELNKAFGR